MSVEPLDYAPGGHPILWRVPCPRCGTPWEFGESMMSPGFIEDDAPPQVAVAQAFWMVLAHLEFCDECREEGASMDEPRPNRAQRRAAQRGRRRR